jgi:hypothetical protein
MMLGCPGCVAAWLRVLSTARYGIVDGVVVVIIPSVVVIRACLLGTLGDHSVAGVRCFFFPPFPLVVTARVWCVVLLHKRSA